MHDLTLFTVPRPFEGPFDAIQRNAIASWLKMDVEVMLLHEPGSDVPDVARELGLPSYEVAVNEYGTPMVDSIFATGFAHAETPLTCYINADIIVLGPLDEAARTCAEAFDRFLMIGQRIDLDMQGANLSFDGDWRGELRRVIGDNGTLHAACGIDYFCSTGNVWGDIPPFALGRAAWDNWLVAAAIRNGVAIIDVTDYVTIVHQSHPVVADIRDRPECKNNYRILSEMGHGSGGVGHASWRLTAEGTMKARGG